MLPKRQLAFLLLTFAQTAVVNSTFAIFAPFFPLFAAERNIRPSGVALVFAAFAVAQLLMAPLAGGLASRYGRKKVLKVGVCLVGSSTLCMGAVADILDGRQIEAMVAALTLLRILQGGGAAMATTCIFAILTDTFPHHKGTVIGVANACDGAGWAIGPPIGGFLYVLGGFRLPFFVVGPLPMLLLVGQLLLWPRVPVPNINVAKASVGAVGADHNGAGDGNITVREVLTRARDLLSPSMLLTMLTSAIFTSKWGCFDVTFTPWAQAEFDFSIDQVSVYFSVPAMAFLFMSPLGGMVVDRVTRKKRLIAMGMLLIGAVCMTMGPWQHQLESSTAKRYQLLLIYLVALGVLSPLIMPAMLPDMLDTTRPPQMPPRDYQPDHHTTNLVTSMFTTSFNLGGIVGPTLGAFAMPALGEAWVEWQHSQDRQEEDVVANATGAEGVVPLQVEVVGFRCIVAVFGLTYSCQGLLLLLYECLTSLWKGQDDRAHYKVVSADDNEESI